MVLSVSVGTILAESPLSAEPVALAARGAGTGGNGADGLIWALVPNGSWGPSDTAPNQYNGSFVLSPNPYVIESAFYDTQEASPAYNSVDTTDSGGYDHLSICRRK